MKCAAVTMVEGKAVNCILVNNHSLDCHLGSRDDGKVAVSWPVAGELDEGVDGDGFYTAYASKGRVDPSKIEWSQLTPFLPALELVARALMHGAKKHNEAPGATAWRDVEDAAHVFGNKCARHGLEHVCGRKFDPESKLPHLAHMIANALILMMTEGDFIK